eukprot:1799161-Rhodomonas_salina.1
MAYAAPRLRGTDLAYGAMRCAVLTECVQLLTCCAMMCGTGIASGALQRAGTLLHTGTDIGHVTAHQCAAKVDADASLLVYSPICLRDCYALSGTGIAYGASMVVPSYARAMPCPVLA